MSGFSLDPKMRLGAPKLSVRNLEKTLSYYEKDLGLTILGTRKSTLGNKLVELSAASAASEPLLVLEQDISKKEPTYNAAGLYHFAILVPDRESLALTFLALGNRGVYFEGYADHLVSESLYLRDPEGNGIEIYGDRPRDEWKYDKNHHIMMDTIPLDFSSLLSGVKSEERKSAKPFPRGARIGHMHLKVTNLEKSKEYYSETLGFDITADLSGFGAIFLSVGGYHHHIGMNIWESKDGAPATTQDSGLDHFTLILPSARALNVLASHLDLEQSKELSFSDPNGIRIRARSD